MRYTQQEDLFYKYLIMVAPIDGTPIEYSLQVAEYHLKTGAIIEAAEKSGFAQGTPIITGAGDQNSAAIGAGLIDNGCISISMGTAGNANAYIDKPFRDPNGKIIDADATKPSDKEAIMKLFSEAGL